MSPTFGSTETTYPPRSRIRSVMTLPPSSSMLSSWQGSFHAFHDPIDRREREILQGVGGRQRQMRRRDADHRAVKREEALLGHDRGDLGAPSAETRVLLHGDETTGLADGLHDCSHVERDQRANVDHL